MADHDTIVDGDQLDLDRSRDAQVGHEVGDHPVVGEGVADHGVDPRVVVLTAVPDLHASYPSKNVNRTSRTSLSTLRSTRQTLCQVPSASRPLRTGTEAYGGTSAGITWLRP